MVRALLLVTILFCGALAPRDVFAQDVQQEVPAPTPAARPAVAADPDLQSPKRTLATFLGAMEGEKEGRSGELDRALKTLDLSEIPDVVRVEKGRDLGVRLYTVLTHAKEFGCLRAPGWAGTTTFTLCEIEGTSIQLDQQDGNWRFSKETLLNAPILFRAVETEVSRSDLAGFDERFALMLRVRRHVPSALMKAHFLIEDWQWLALFGALALVALFHWIVVRFVTWIVSKRVSEEREESLRTRVRQFAKPLSWILITYVVQVVISPFDLPPAIYGSVATVLGTIRSVLTVVLAIRMIDLSVEVLRPYLYGGATVSDDILLPLFQRGAWLVIVSFGVVHIISLYGVDVTGLVAGLGLGGLAFALAAKDTVENIFGSIAILVDRPFRVGDAVVIDNINGTVERIGLRTTRIRTAENSVVSMPNSKVIASHVDNLGARSFVRTRVALTLPYDTEPERIEAFCSKVRDILKAEPRCRQDNVFVHVTGFGPSGLEMVVQCYLRMHGFLEDGKLQEDIFLKMLRAANDAGVRFAYPTHSVAFERKRTAGATDA